MNVVPLPNNARGLPAADGLDAAPAPLDGSAVVRPRRGLAALRSSGLMGSERAQETGSGAGPASQPIAASVRVAEQLRAACDGGSVVLLHHRAAGHAVPRLDHLVVGPSGVWVTHSRFPKGRVETREPMFGRTKLTIGGKERMDLLATLDQQRLEVVRALEGVHQDVPVRSALCFADTEAPLQRMLYLGSYLFFGAESLALHLASEGPLTPTAVRAVADTLEAGFPPA